MENSEDDDLKIVFTGPAPAATLSASKIPTSVDGSEFPSATKRSTKYISLPLLCRLCAKPSEMMTDIFEHDAAGQDIPAMIHLCLPIMVQRTDTLPIRVCRTCLEELKRCYQFHQTVAEAEEQLLAFGRLEGTKKTLTTFTQCGGEAHKPIEHDDTDEALKATHDTGMGNDMSTEEAEKTPSNSKRQNADLTTSGIAQRTTCDPKVTGSARCRIVAKEMQGDGAKRFQQIDKDVQRLARTEERQYSCGTCAKQLKSKKGLANHLKTHSSHRTRHKCNLCSKAFISKNRLYYHRKWHSSPEEFTCNICAKMFASKDYLSKHLEVHSGIRELYTCKFCTKTFLSKVGLSGHLKTHSGLQKTP